MKNIFTMKNLIAAILAGLVLMFIMVTTPKGTEPLSPDGNYTYPEYCIGHESEFVVNKAANSYINHGFVGDAITYVGSKGFNSYGNFELTASSFDESTNSFYNPSIDLGFKLPEGWQAVCGTPTAGENSAYFYDFSAVSPDGEYMLTVKYHDLEADGITIKNEKDYILYYGDVKTDKYWQDGYKNISGSNVFLGDKFCHLTEMYSLETDEKAVDMGRIFLANQLMNKKYVLLVEYRTPYYNVDHSVWQQFFCKN
ncbi:MAG: hypothetical protein E7483_01555 [Ruminococcaceae bacterium]|nr:hypothetical protein [Oscillospiraceae bacterium]